MSVTFSIDSNPTGEFTLSPACAQEVPDPFEGQVFASYDEAVAVIVEHKTSCEDCAAYGCYTQCVLDVSSDFDVNLSQTNAAMIIKRLGLDRDEHDDLVGCLPAEDLLGRVLTALALVGDDAGVPATTSVGARGAISIDCGLAPGYLTSTLTRLHALVVEAARLGRHITWG